MIQTEILKCDRCGEQISKTGYQDFSFEAYAHSYGKHIAMRKTLCKKCSTEALTALLEALDSVWQELP